MVLFALLTISAFFEIYIIDLPMGISYYLQNIDMRLNSFKYNMLYTVFSLPNIFLAFLIGTLVSKFGINKIFIFCWFSTLIGQILIFLGGFYLNYWLILTGRIFSGIGCENTFISRMILIGDWFWNYEISVAYSLILIFGRYGTNTVGLISPYLYKINNSLFWPLLVPLAMAIISFFLSIIIFFIDKKYVKRPEQKPNQLLTRHKEVIEIEETNKNIGIIEYLDSQLKLTTYSDKNFFAFSKLKKLGGLYIVFFLLFSLQYGTLYAWIGNTNEFLCTYYQLTPEKAGRYMFFTFIFAFFGPIIGIILDKYGKRLYVLLFGMIIYAFFFSLTIYWPFEYKDFIYINFFCFGFAYSFFICTFYPCFKCYINPEVNSIGNSMLSSGMNLFVVINTFCFGIIKDSTRYKENGYFYSYWFLILQVFTIIICIGIIILYNRKHNMKMNTIKLK